MMVLRTSLSTSRGNRLTQCRQQVVPGLPNLVNSQATALRGHKSRSKYAAHHEKNELVLGDALKKKLPHSSSCRTNAHFVPRYSELNTTGNGMRSRSIYLLRNGFARFLALVP